MRSSNFRLWVARVLIGLVLFFNLQCALLFIVKPGNFAAGFELEGIAGSVMVQGMGLLFVMWNVPYALALTHPRLRRVSLYEAIAMQAIGVLGESALLFLLPPGHPALRATAVRFIYFDAGGLLALLLAFGVSQSTRPPALKAKVLADFNPGRA